MRLRPCQDLSINQYIRILVNYCPQSSSFPSSHAVNHFAAATFIYQTLKFSSKWWRLMFVWAFASTSNTMVSNLMGQKREDKVLKAITSITYWSFSLCLIMCALLNIFPATFFRLFGQGDDFVTEAIPVVRIVSLGLMFMSIANIWLNGVTGTAKTKVNLMIEIVAISIYLIYSWYFVKVQYTSLAMA